MPKHRVPGHTAAGQSPQSQRTGIAIPVGAILLLALAAGALSACNTIAGVGKDVEKAGQALDKAAR